jgi:hypothetical protein
VPAIPHVDRATIERALERFDRELRDGPDWRQWEERTKYKFAIEHDGRRYPVRLAISLATGYPRRDFGGREANDYAIERGFKIVLLRPPGSGLQASIESILSMYAAARIQPFTGAHPASKAVEELADQLALKKKFCSVKCRTTYWNRRRDQRRAAAAAQPAPRVRARVGR